MSSRPLLTVFTTFFDETQYFDATIASILSQSFTDFEYLITSDGDPALSESIAKRFPDRRIRLLTVARQNLPLKRQQGLELARGELIALIDSDDFCELDRLERQVNFLRGNPDHVLIGSALRFVDEHSRTLGFRDYPEDDEQIKKRLPVFNCIAQSSVMARRDALLAAGGYDSSFRWGTEDYDLWLRLARHGRFHNFREPLTAYRIHVLAAKKRYLKQSLRDAIRLKIRALRQDGFSVSTGALVSIILHAALLLLPSSWVWAAFKRFVVFRGAPASTSAV